MCLSMGMSAIAHAFCFFRRLILTTFCADLKIVTKSQRAKDIIPNFVLDDFILLSKPCPLVQKTKQTRRLDLE